MGFSMSYQIINQINSRHEGDTDKLRVDLFHIVEFDLTVLLFSHPSNHSSLMRMSPPGSLMKVIFFFSIHDRIVLGFMFTLAAT